MDLSVFSRKLNKIEPRLRVDLHRIRQSPHHKDYPLCGLYWQHDVHILGIPQIWVPEWSVAGANLKQLANGSKKDKTHLQYIFKNGFIPEGSKIEERILWRGLHCILASLVRNKYLDKAKAEKEFKVKIQPLKMEFPRNYVNIEI